MAQRTTVVLLDDLDEGPADETVEFGLDGVTYEIDLSDTHARALRDELAPFVAHARRTSPARAGRAPAEPAAPAAAAPAARTRTATAAPAVVDREQNKAVRDWAGRHGHPLPPRGRIPAAVSEAFHRGDPTALPGAAVPATPAEPQAAVPTEPDAAPASAATPATPAVGADGLTGEERETIRAWALEEGIEVKSRGRLTKDLIANYRAVRARR